MTTEQLAIAVEEKIRDVAKRYGVKPSEIHDHHKVCRNPEAYRARIVAVSELIDDGLDRSDIAWAFNRDRDTITEYYRSYVQIKKELA